jgi:hypothetical protein
MNRWVVAWLMAAVVLALPAPGSAQWAPVQAEPAQTQPERKAKKPRARAPQPDLDEEDQLSPRQLDQRPPGRPARQSEPPRSRADPPTAALPPPAAEGSRTAADGARTIACTGVFGKDSSHLKLATRFDSRNVAFTEVDGPEGSRLMASVLFPNDPKRRLEVLWQNEASRTETHLIVINGRSTWTAPKGLRLGLPLAALEKLNGKPFRMSGFDQPNGGSAIDWDGGALDRLPGGCRLGIRLAPDAKATDAARNEVMGTEFLSNDPKMRAVRPIVAEILIGY